RGAFDPIDMAIAIEDIDTWRIVIGDPIVRDDSVSEDGINGALPVIDVGGVFLTREVRGHLGGRRPRRRTVVFVFGAEQYPWIRIGVGNQRSKRIRIPP